MDFVFTKATEQILKGAIDFVNDDIRVILVDNTNTALADRDAATISGITTLGELAGTGYARKSLANQAVVQDDPNDQSYFDADDVGYTGINAGTAEAALVYKHVTSDADSIPLFYLDGGQFPIVTNGSDVTIQWTATGLMKAKTGV